MLQFWFWVSFVLLRTYIFMKLKISFSQVRYIDADTIMAITVEPNALILFSNEHLSVILFFPLRGTQSKLFIIPTDLWKQFCCQMTKDQRDPGLIADHELYKHW